MTGSARNWVFACVAVLAGTQAVSAQDSLTLRGTTGTANSTTLTLGGKGSTEQAASEDNELTHGYRYRGGYYGWGGYSYGYGYRGFYAPVVTYNYYRPAYFYTPQFVAPVYYAPRPVFYTPYYNCGPGVSFYLGISGGAGTGAPAVNLGDAKPMTQPNAPYGTFRYDGGPANPVPVPKADPQPIPPANSSATTNDLPVSLKPKAAPSPYKYKAYGEK
jgi:hypothetical protein